MYSISPQRVPTDGNEKLRLTKEQFKRYLTPSALSVAVILVAMIAVLSSSASISNSMTKYLTYVVMVTALYVFCGPSGLMSFGHAAFMSIGAYASALMVVPVSAKVSLVLLPDIVRNEAYGFWQALLVAVVLGALVSAGLGAILMRLNGLAAGISTLAVLVIVFVIINHTTLLTKGPSALVGVPALSTPTVAAVMAIATIWLAFIFQRSSTGLKLIASRNDALAARASGVNIFKARLIAFILSGALMAAAGALYGMNIRVLNPDTLYLDITLMMIAMLVVGGMRSLTGAVVGALLISVVSEVFRNIEGGVQIFGIVTGEVPGLTQIVISAVLLGTLIISPSGITKSKELDELIFRRSDSK